MGGAQPLAVTLNEGVCLIIDVDRRDCSAGLSIAISTRLPMILTRLSRVR